MSSRHSPTVRGAQQSPGLGRGVTIISGAEELRLSAFPPLRRAPAPADESEGRPAEAARRRLRREGDWRNDGGIDCRRQLTEQSPTATAEPIDKGCTADARTPTRHGAAGGVLLPRRVGGDLHRRVDCQVKRTGGGPGALRRSRGSTGPARKGAGWHARLPPGQARLVTRLLQAAPVGRERHGEASESREPRPRSQWIVVAK